MLSGFLSLSLLPLAFGLPTSLDPAPVARQQVCNGHAELCDRKYGEVVYIGAHNSYAYGQDAGGNQNKDPLIQLNDGIRLLQIQGHDFGSTSDSNPSGIQLCHTSCFLENGGTLESYLQIVKSWMEANPNEVLTLLPTNPDHLDVETWGKAFAYVGLDQMAYVPSGNTVGRENWPTLSQMIGDKRLVIFFDYGADLSKVNYLIPEFDNIWENKYDQTDLPFDCSLDRGTASADRFSMLNMAIDFKIGDISLPDGSRSAEVNSADGDNGIVSTVNRCSAVTGKKATFVLVDYYDVPAENGVFVAANRLNGF